MYLHKSTREIKYEIEIMLRFIYNMVIIFILIFKTAFVMCIVRVIKDSYVSWCKAIILNVIVSTGGVTATYMTYKKGYV